MNPYKPLSSLFDSDSRIDMITKSADGISLILNAFEGIGESKRDLDDLSARLRTYVDYAKSEDFSSEYGQSKPQIRIFSFSDPTQKVRQFVQEVSKVSGISIEFQKLD